MRQTPSAAPHRLRNIFHPHPQQQQPPQIVLRWTRRSIRWGRLLLLIFLPLLTRTIMIRRVFSFLIPLPPRPAPLRMVFERMSEDCIEILVLAQEQATLRDPDRTLSATVDTNMILTGCCHHALSNYNQGSTKTNRQLSPSLLALQKTFTRFNISKRRMDTVMSSMYVPKTDVEQSWINPFRQNVNARKKGTDDDRPFSTSSKYTMNRAQLIANHYNNPMIECHYLFLALLDFQPSTLATASTSSSSSSHENSNIRTDPSATESNDVWKTLLKLLPVTNTNSNSNSNNNNNNDDDVDGTSTSGLKPTISTGTTTNITALDICQTCITYYEQEVARRKGKKELVLTGAASTSSSSKSSSGILDDIGMDLTQMARDELLDVVHGRDKEIYSCLRTLLRRRKNNIVLLGNAGVGKTAIVEGLAQLMNDRSKCPPSLYNSRIISIEISNLIANTKYRGEFEERLQSIITEVTAQQQASSSSSSSLPPPRIILFFDEIHTIMGTGNAGGGEGGSIDAANILKPALARGTIQLIGATTIEEYRNSIEKDVAFARRLQPIYINEPNMTQCINIIEKCVAYYEEYHNVQYTPTAIRAAVELSERYINDRFLPDKAIDLIDEAGAMIQLQRNSNNDDINWDTINTDYEMLLDNSNAGNTEERLVVTEDTIMELISEWSGIPLGKIELSEQEKLLSIESILSQRVIGQKRPIVSVSRAIRRARSGLHDPKRPIASFMFCGPTGVGKTELCKSLADVYYGNEKDMIRIDMSEYQDRYTVSRLTGPPPGYVGYESGGQLTEAVRRNSHSLILFDEIEKAHEDVLNILLQILEDGILTDGKGRTINFKNTIIVMTSNIGSRRILQLCRTTGSTASNISNQNLSAQTADTTNAATPSGLDVIRNSIKDTLDSSTPLVNDIKSMQQEKEHFLYPQLIEVVKEELESTMKPELLNRIDEIVVFSPLSHENLIQIAKLNVDRIVKRIFDEHNITLSISDAVIERIVSDGSMNADQFGARPMRRATQRFVEDSISDAYIQGFIRKNEFATLSIPVVSENEKTNKDCVIVTKSVNNENGGATDVTLVVNIVDSSGGIGSTSATQPRRQPPPFVTTADECDLDEINGQYDTAFSMPLSSPKT
jgi:ATP-dependent Clp protease ATP-binding subunit ClpC